MLTRLESGRADVAIVGGGPAGLAAATYLGRFMRSVVVLDAGNARARLIPSTHNCPGFPHGISGVDLLARLREQATSYGARIVAATVNSVDRRGDGFILSTTDGMFETSFIIMASGVVDRAPAMPGLKERVAAGKVRMCPLCDGYEVAGKRIGVIGPEDLALGEAMFLRHYSSDIVLLAKPPSDFSPATRMQASQAGIELWDSVDDIEDDGPGLAVAMAGGSARRGLDTIYVAMGCDVRSELALSLGASADEEGYILVDRKLRSSVQGLYAIGDVAKALNQIAVGFGQAAIASTDIHNALRMQDAANR